MKHNGLWHRFHNGVLGRIAREWPSKLGGRHIYNLWLNTRPKVIYCKRCGKGHPSAVGTVGDGTQGQGCATSCHGNMFRSHYGSTFDTSVHQAVLTLNWKFDPLCDDCLRGLADSGVVKYVGGYL